MVLNDLNEVDKADSRIKTMFNKEQTKEIKRNIIEDYMAIAQSSLDMDNNSDELSKRVIKMIGKYHVYWNIKRFSKSKNI